MTWAWLSFRSRAAAALLDAALTTRSVVRLTGTAALVLLILLRALGARNLVRLSVQRRRSLRGAGVSALLRDLPRPEVPVGDPVGGHPRAEATPGPRIRVRLPRGRASGRLTDPRVRRLQAAALRRVLLQRCGVWTEPGELDALAGWSSSAWVLRNVLTAAGLTDGALVREDEYVHRCLVVFPAVLRSLSMAPPEAPAGDRSRAAAGGTDPGVRGSLYPREIAGYRRRLRAEQAVARTSHRYRTQRGREALIRFAVYCRAVSVLGGVAAEPQRSACPPPPSRNLRRALRALETTAIHQGG